MNNVAIPHELHCACKLLQEATYDYFIEASILPMPVLVPAVARAAAAAAAVLGRCLEGRLWCIANVVREISGCAKGHDEKDAILCAEAIEQLDDVDVSNGTHDADLALEVLQKLGRELASIDDLDGHILRSSSGCARTRRWHSRQPSMHNGKRALAYLTPNLVRSDTLRLAARLRARWRS